VREFNHDPDGTRSFTQGLEFHPDGTLYESVGLYGKSHVRSINLHPDGTMEVLAKAKNQNHIFAEGIAIDGDNIYQVTWKEKTLNTFSRAGGKLALTGSKPFTIGAEGWGLALRGDKLYLTDSGDSLYTLDKSNFQQIGKEKKIIDPKLKGADESTNAFAISGVNELEMVEGELWGNVYPMYQGSHSECIVRINATTAEVIGWIDMHGLLAKQDSHVRNNPGSYVLNGIAYHGDSGRLYVTGKEWKKIYQVRIHPTEYGPDHVMRKCGLGHVSRKYTAGRRRLHADSQ